MVRTKKCPYRDSERVCGPRAEWIAYMLHDMGVTDDDVDKRVQEAINKYIVGLVDDEKLEPCEVTMGELEIMVSNFWGGYEQAYVDLGALKSRSDGGPHSEE